MITPLLERAILTGHARELWMVTISGVLALSLKKGQAGIIHKMICFPGFAGGVNQLNQGAIDSINRQVEIETNGSLSTFILRTAVSGVQVPAATFAEEFKYTECGSTIIDCMIPFTQQAHIRMGVLPTPTAWVASVFGAAGPEEAPEPVGYGPAGTILRHANGMGGGDDQYIPQYEELSPAIVIRSRRSTGMRVSYAGGAILGNLDSDSQYSSQSFPIVNVGFVVFAQAYLESVFGNELKQ